MVETRESNSRSRLQVALGLLLGVLVCVGCLIFSILLGAALGLSHPWTFPALNAITLVASGMVALRNINKSSYSEGVLIAVSVAFILNVVFLALTRPGYVE
jgi:hypothetical protein